MKQFLYHKNNSLCTFDYSSLTLNYVPMSPNHYFLSCNDVCLPLNYCFCHSMIRQWCLSHSSLCYRLLTFNIDFRLFACTRARKSSDWLNRVGGQVVGRGLQVISDAHQWYTRLSLVCHFFVLTTFWRHLWSIKPGLHIVVSVVSVVRKKFIGQIEWILSRTTSCICRFFCIEHLYGRFP